MLDKTFDAFWNKSVVRAAKDIEQICPSLIEKYHVTLDISEKTKDDIYQRYKVHNKYIHDNYFYGKNEKLIDYHKIAACFAKAIIEIAPFEFDIKENPPLIIKVINYMLAFHASVNMINIIMTHGYKSNPELYEKAVKRENMLYPKTSFGHDTYTVGRVKSIALNDINGKDFDLFAFADMLFWIEQYNKQIIEDKIFLN